MRWLLGFLLALCPGCTRFTWGHVSRFEPIEPAAVARLEAHQTELGQCLSAFGAPLWVWEQAENGKTGAVLAYGWFDERDFGGRVTVPVTRGFSAYFDYEQIDQRMRGLVLFFDAAWRLTTWRVGFLRDLTRAVRRPPAALAEEV